jgi:hypothetical protein
MPLFGADRLGGASPEERLREAGSDAGSGAGPHELNSAVTVPDFSEAILARVERRVAFVDARGRARRRFARVALGSFAAGVAAVLVMVPELVPLDVLAWVRPAERPISRLVLQARQSAQSTLSELERGPWGLDAPGTTGGYGRAMSAEAGARTEGQSPEACVSAWAGPVLPVAQRLGVSSAFWWSMPGEPAAVGAGEAGSAGGGVAQGVLALSEPQAHEVVQNVVRRARGLTSQVGFAAGVGSRAVAPGGSMGVPGSTVDELAGGLRGVPLSGAR